MVVKYSNLILVILFLIVMVISFIFWDYKLVPEFFVILLYSMAVFHFLKVLFQKTNNKRIIVKTKKFNWIPMIIWIALGVFKIVHKNYFDSELIFGFLPESTSQGIGFILIGMASFQRNIIIDDNGIRINNWLTSMIKYNDLTEFNLTSSSLMICDKSLSYRYRIFKLSIDEISLINKKMEENVITPSRK